MEDKDFDTSNEIDTDISNDQYEELGRLFEGEPADEATADPESDDVENNEEDTPDTDDEDGDVENQEQSVFADEQHKVRLADGTETTVHELMRGNLRESDYTRKTTEVAEQRNQVQQQQQKLADATDLIGQAIQQYQPQEPRFSDFEQDPMAFERAKEQYRDDLETFNQSFGALSQVQEQQKQHLQAQQQEYLQKEHQAMLSKHPEFSDPSKLTEFQAKAVPIFSEFGFTPEDLGEIDDHRMIGVMKELVEYRELKANRQKAVKQTQNKPKMVTGSNRKSSNPANSRSINNRIKKAASNGDARDISDILGQLLEG